MAWISFDALPCRKNSWWQLVSRCCWNRARPWYASELVSFLVGLRTYQYPGNLYIIPPSTCLGQKNLLKWNNYCGLFQCLLIPYRRLVTICNTCCNNKHIIIFPTCCLWRLSRILPIVLYGRETWSLIFMEECRVGIFVNRVMRRIFGPKRDEENSSQNIIRVIKCIGMWRSVFSAFDSRGAPKGKQPLGRPRHRWEDNMKIDLQYFWWKGGGWHGPDWTAWR